MSTAPSSLRLPPTSRKGLLTRRAVTIPKKQRVLLEEDTSWISSLGDGGELQINDLQRIQQLSTAAAKELKANVDAAATAKELKSKVDAAAAAAVPAASTVPVTEPEPAPLEPAATETERASLADSVKVAPVENPTPSRDDAPAKEPPSAVSLPSLHAQVSPPPVRASVPATAPPEAAAQTDGKEQLPVASEPLAQVESAPSPAQLQRTAVAATQPDPARYDRSSPPNLDRDKQENGVLYTQAVRQETTETVDRQPSEIPATPEKQLQSQFQKTVEPTGAYSPDWPEEDDEVEDEIGDEIEDEDEDNVEDEGDGEQEGPDTDTAGADRMQVDGDDQEDEAQQQTEQTAPTAAKTHQRTSVSRRKSPILSSCAYDELEFHPVQALAHPGSPEAGAYAASDAPPPSLPPRSPTQLADALAAQTASRASSHRASPALSSGSKARPVTLPVQPQPAANRSRAPSDDGRPPVRRRRMKGPVFPSSPKNKTAGTPQYSRMESPASSVFATRHASHKLSSRALPVHTPMPGRESSRSPLMPASNHGNAAGEKAASQVKRRESDLNSAEKQKTEEAQTDVALESAPVSGVSSFGPAVAAAVAAATHTAHVGYQSSPTRTAVQPTAATPYNAATRAVSVHKVLYRTPAANSPRPASVPNSASVVGVRESPSMSPRHTWMLPYETFTSAYPDYTGDLEDFLRACYCVLGISKARQLASYQFDDVVRAYLEYIDYVHGAASAAPLNLHQWYLENTDDMIYHKNVVTRSNVNAILMAYPDKLQSIQLLAETVQTLAPAPASASAPTPAAAIAIHEPQVAATAVLSISNHDNDNDNDTAGRLLSIDGVPHGGSQDDSGLSAPNSLLNLSILASSGESVWHHCQPSSPPSIRIAPDDGPTQSPFLSQDMSVNQLDSLDSLQQQQQQQQLDSVPRPDSQIQSSCLTNAENELPLPRSPISTAALPSDIDRMAYLLQSPPSVPPTDPRLRPHIPSQSSRATASHLPSYHDWSMVDDDTLVETPARTKARTPAKTPAKTPASSQVSKTRLQPIVNSLEQTPVSSGPAAVSTSTGRKRSREDRENQPLASAAVEVEAAEAADKAFAARQDPAISDIPDDDDQDSGDEYSETMDVSFMSVQSAREVRQRPSPSVQPRARVEARRATIAGPDIGMIARMAAAEDALVAAAQNHALPLPPPTMAAAPSGPPKKKRKKAAAGKKTAGPRLSWEEYLVKKRAEKELAEKLASRP